MYDGKRGGYLQGDPFNHALARNSGTSKMQRGRCLPSIWCGRSCSLVLITLSVPPYMRHSGPGYLKKSYCFVLRKYRGHSMREAHNVQTPRSVERKTARTVDAGCMLLHKSPKGEYVSNTQSDNTKRSLGALHRYRPFYSCFVVVYESTSELSKTTLSTAFHSRLLFCIFLGER